MTAKMTRNILLMLVATVLMGIVLNLYIHNTGTVPAADNAAPLADGSYTSAAQGCMGEVTVTVTVTGGGLAEAVTAQETVGVASGSRLSVCKSLSPTVVAENGQLTYTFTIQNRGNTAVTAADDVTLRDVFKPILKNITVTYNGTAWSAGTEYTYSETTGEFVSAVGQITVPAATYTQDPVTGVWSVTPGSSVLVITGTV